MANYYAVPNPSFQRAMRNILSISQSNPAIITTTFDGINPGPHDYSTGLIVRLDIPDGFGMKLVDQYANVIVVINANQFTLPIDTTFFDAFSVPPFTPGLFGTPAQVVPIGEVNEILTMATQNVLPYP